MARGGKRPGAGAPKGSHNRKAIKDGSLRDYAPQVKQVIDEMLLSKDEADRKWIVRELLPYVFRRQPQEITGEGGERLFDAIEVLIIKK